MIVKKQKPITFINDCNALVDYVELEKAILWYQNKPTVSIKRIYLYSNYPTVTINGNKVHVHRLLMMYWSDNVDIKLYVHHKDENKLNALKYNLVLIEPSIHQSQHNANKKLSKQHINKIIENNRKRKGIRKRYVKNVTPKEVYDLKNKGYSFNKISIMLNLDWSCVKQRYTDFIHDNPELLEL